MEKLLVTIEALEARIKQKLAPLHLALVKSSDGVYAVQEMQLAKTCHRDSIDLEAYAREIGVLAEGEVLATSANE